MKGLFLIAAVIFLAAKADSWGETQAERNVVEMVGYPEKLDLRILDGPSGKETIQLLRSIANHTITNIGTASFVGPEADSILLTYGDDYSITRAILSYQYYYETRRGNDWARLIERSKQPKFIPYLIGDAFLEDDMKGKFHGDGFEGEFVDARSQFSPVIAARIIISSKAFSPEVVEWARKLEWLSNNQPATFRDEIRHWWKANIDAFTRHDYLAVQPGTPVVELLPKPTPNPDETPIPSLKSEPPASTPKLATPSKTPLLKSTASAPIRFPVLSLIALLLASVATSAVYLFWKTEK